MKRSTSFIRDTKVDCPFDILEDALDSVDVSMSWVTIES
jgi:hypothetical protein